VFSLAIGIGANAPVFSFVNATFVAAVAGAAADAFAGSQAAAGIFLATTPIDEW
jgi:hypothetical protein